MGHPVRSWIPLAVVICMKGRPERGADTGLRLDPDAPAVMFDDLLADREAAFLQIARPLPVPA